MFIRVKKSKNSPKRSVQIVESFRNNKNKPRQRIVRHIGTAMTDAELERLHDFAEYEKSLLEEQKTPGLFTSEQVAQVAIENRKRKNDKPINVDLKKLREEQRITTGIHDAFGCIYDKIGFDTLFTSRKKACKKYLRHITMARIANPDSKRKNIADLSEDFGLSLSLDSTYRMMDNIDQKVIEKAQGLAYSSAKQLFGNDINVLFYDCTTLYFESFTEDDLKKNGYSKDMKFNQPQVVLALLVTQDGLPVGYEVFPGNQYEGHTLETIIPKIKRKYKLSRIIFTADSAMLSKNNLDYLEREKVEYIVAARLKNLTKTWQKKITGSTEAMRSFDYGKDRRLIVTYSDKLARKNKHDRDTAIEKLRAKLEHSENPSSLISNYGYKRFLKITGQAKVELDESKYEQAAKFDGLHGVITNAKDLSDDDVLEHYKGLWQIEECFRISKHDLKIRPIFHWTPARIKAHILICFLALTCVRHMVYTVKIKSEQMSAARIINALNHIQESILFHITEDKKYALPSKFNEDARTVYKSLNLRIDTTPYQIH